MEGESYGPKTRAYLQVLRDGLALANLLARVARDAQAGATVGELVGRIDRLTPEAAALSERSASVSAAAMAAWGCGEEEEPQGFSLRVKSLLEQAQAAREEAEVALRPRQAELIAESLRRQRE